jgi:hypothetical protein
MIFPSIFLVHLVNTTWKNISIFNNWKSFLHTTWDLFAYHKLGTPTINDNKQTYNFLCRAHKVSKIFNVNVQSVSNFKRQKFCFKVKNKKIWIFSFFQETKERRIRGFLIPFELDDKWIMWKVTIDACSHKMRKK